MEGRAAPWSNLHARAQMLPARERACFALACAEHLVSRERSAGKEGLRDALAVGWAAVAGNDDGLEGWRARIGARDDLDDDDVAAVAFALDAAASPGSIDPILWASMRALDAAYERVPYNRAVTSFQPVDQDSATPDVQDELVWQAEVLAVLEGSNPIEEVISRLRF